MELLLFKKLYFAVGPFKDVRTMSAVLLSDDTTTSFPEANLMATIMWPSQFNSIGQEWLTS